MSTKWTESQLQGNIVQIIREFCANKPRHGPENKNEFAEMSMDLFEKIVDEILQFTGTVHVPEAELSKAIATVRQNAHRILNHLVLVEFEVRDEPGALLASVERLVELGADLREIVGYEPSDGVGRIITVARMPVDVDCHHIRQRLTSTGNGVEALSVRKLQPSEANDWSILAALLPQPDSLLLQAQEQSDVYCTSFSIPDRVGELARLLRTRIKGRNIQGIVGFAPSVGEALITMVLNQRSSVF